VVGELLSQRWSPQQISRHLRQRFPHDPAMWLCHEGIYQALYQPGSPLMRPSPVPSLAHNPVPWQSPKVISWRYPLGSAENGQMVQDRACRAYGRSGVGVLVGIDADDDVEVLV